MLVTSSCRRLASTAIARAALFALGLCAVGALGAQDLELVCKSKLDLKTLASYREFVDELAALPLNTQTDRSKSNLKKCLDERESIVALRDLIVAYDKKRPCKLVEVKRLEDYARKYLLENKKALTLKFFSLFGVSVAIGCKINLLAHLRQADTEVDQMDFIYSMASPTGWNTLINEYTKKSMKFGTSGHADSHVINRIVKLIPGLSQVDHLDFMDFDHVMNDQQTMGAAAAATLHDGVEQATFELKNAQLQPKVLESLEKISQACRNLDQFYVNSVLALAKLKELGLLVDILNDLHDHSALLHKWLAVTSFCQLMARVRIVTGSAQSEASIQLEIVHDDKLLEDRRRLYSYAAPFEDIHPKAHELVWQASVNEGSWRQKSAAMWPKAANGKPSGASEPQSVAMKQLAQFVKGIEHDFQDDLQQNDR